MSDELKTQTSGIVHRTMAYSVRIVKLYRALEKDSAGRIIGRQLLRAGTSIGANVHEAQAAQTRNDFIAKMYIGYKEARESAYWLRLIREAGIIPGRRINDLANETEQLIKILSAILRTAKQGGRNSRKAVHS